VFAHLCVDLGRLNLVAKAHSLLDG
jgi:hypothetical protein